MIKRKFASKITSVLALAIFAGTITVGMPLEANATTNDKALHKYEILTKTNEYRAGEGLAKVNPNAHLDSIAQYWADEMAKNSIFYHNPEVFNSVFAQNHWRAAAENIAAGQSNGTNVTISWWNSPGHKTNMLGDYTHIGVGVAYGGYYGKYYVQVYGKSATAPTENLYPDPNAKPIEPDPSIEKGDVLVRSEAGALLNFGNITSKVGVRKQIGTGWGQFKDINVADFDNDGLLDLIANRTVDNRLYLYKGKLEGGFNSPVNIGGTTSWGNATIRIGKLQKTNEFPTVFATFGDGNVYKYETANGLTLLPGVLLANGFDKFSHINVGYADNDENIDIVAQDERGRQIMHRTDGNVLINERRFPIGQHWENYQPTSTAHQKDGKTGFIAQREGGNLYYYNLSGGSIISGKALIGINWAPYYVLPQSY